MALIKCPECGKDVSDKSDVCIHCGYPLKEYILQNKYTLAMQHGCPKCGHEYRLLIENGGYIFCGKCMHEEIIDEKLYEQYKYEQRKKQQEEANKPKCPRCGCTDIQVVNKKWSLFSGFMTNDVDRVCTKCKWKW